MRVSRCHRPIASPRKYRETTTMLIDFELSKEVKTKVIRVLARHFAKTLRMNT